MNAQPLPIILKDTYVEAALREVVELTPKGQEVYLHGGALRNSIYFHLTGEIMPQRDYDLIVMGDKDSFISALTNAGFIMGKKNTPTTVVLKKPKKENPSEDFADWIVLDVVFRQNTTIETVLAEKVNFTINGSAIKLEDLFLPTWYERLISLPGAMQDLKSRVIKTNKAYPINIYACIRFVSQGFSVSTEEVEGMVVGLKEIPLEKFQTNVDKVISYVGSREAVLSIAKQIGVRINILDLKEIQAS
jgi:hypothetical protein